MRAVDTNLLVRLLVRDDAAQVVAAESFIENGAWVSHLVLAETLWVLDAVYERKPNQIAKAIELLVAARIISPAWFRAKSLELTGVVADCATGWRSVGRWSNPS
jgi:predicted nucleic-acid-binding protein